MIATIGRLLIAFAAVGVLSIDDWSNEMRIYTSATPRTTDPAEWARHNQQAGPGCVVPVEPERPLELAPHEVGSPVRELLTAVERAASELHGQGAKSDRIALQLLTAIARFEGEVSP